LGLRKATPAQNRLPKQPTERYPIGAGTVLAYLPAVGICALLLVTMLLGCFMPL